ncbi:ferritin-like domain-containing protein [Ramlibacter tataouinensis]|uniref:Ferritin/DPS protein domain-containing protein n=1 Tax=Ramlibacter tataouinensis (strain ATCC BAA-407 / DSM 14655 / LMG 21543 / TTB310) TaxID=365046 RepID=F5XYK5_RAMTT|nr:ferritin-like domain-containing protein [Ramlibacter tataouinensis]AEG93181.1 hypothetical protein Rta_20870 [Ramlibacter tataouinensis TTB310]
MEATLPGKNRTGTATSPVNTQAMTEAAAELSPAVPVDTAGLEAERILYINGSESVGSIPPPTDLKGVFKNGIAKIKGGQPSILMDKVGERIAFERGSVRLYEALIAKYEATAGPAGGVLPMAQDVIENEMQALAVLAPVEGEQPLDTLRRIRTEELVHFKLVCDGMVRLGGDPTAQTPCADVIGTASLGLIQVVTDPRTTLAQSLTAILTAELTDNAGWELLIQLAEQSGESELAGEFLGALAQEQEHLATIKGWVAALVSQGAGTNAV